MNAEIVGALLDQAAGLLALLRARRKTIAQLECELVGRLDRIAERLEVRRCPDGSSAVRVVA